MSMRINLWSRSPVQIQEHVGNRGPCGQLGRAFVPAGSGPVAAPDKLVAAEKSVRNRSYSASKRATSGSISSISAAGKGRVASHTAPALERPSRRRAQSAAQGLWRFDVTGSFIVTKRLERRVGAHSLDRADFAARGVEAAIEG